jgi:O-antigen/teichoic acid export membrane protein
MLKLLLLSKNLLNSRFLNSGHTRSVIVKKNIFALFCIKGISVINTLLLVPLSISYLNKENYGVWLTIYSMLSWLGLLDIGLGNGLRNKFAECKANGNLKQIKTYVSTAYFLLTFVMLLTLIVFFIINQFIDWQKVLNVNTLEAIVLKKTVVVVFIFFCAQLVVKLISSILIADQKAFMAAAINTISSILTLVSVFVLSKTSGSSIYYMAFLVGLINVLVPLVISIYYFATIYKFCSPSLSSVSLKNSKSLINIGLIFFLFQSSALIIVATDNIIISHLFGPEEVTPYNIAIKYFAPLTIVFSILSTPLWSAYTEAFEQNDFNWIKKITKKMMKIWTLLIAAFIPGVLLSPYIFKMWIGETVDIPIWLTFWVGIYALISSWNQIFTNFINGVSKVRLGFYLTLITGAINIPLCLFLADYCKLGTIGIIMAASISLLPDLIFLPLQYFKIVNQKADGIWNK